MYEEMLRELENEALQLERWARESRQDGWSTHQVEPMLKRAQELWAIIGRARRMGGY